MRSIITLFIVISFLVIHDPKAECSEDRGEVSATRNAAKPDTSKPNISKPNISKTNIIVIFCDDLASTELYHLERDISEKHNVADQYPDVVERLTAKVREHLADIEPHEDMLAIPIGR